MLLYCYFYLIRQILEKMGCGLTRRLKYDQSFISKLKDVFNETQISILLLFFQDLSQRNAYQKMDYENFRLFFRKNGFWTEQIFKCFDLNGQELLNEQQFLKGIAKMYRSTQEQKANLLFSHFSSRCQQQGQEGLLYKDFLRMLYNYPKTDLKQILQDQYFFEEQIKKNIVNVNSNSYKTVSTIPERQTVVYGLIQDGTQMQSVMDQGQDEQRHKRNSNELRQQYNSRQHKICASLTFFLYNKNLNVKMTSIHALVKKYAQMIFNQFHMNIKTGRLKEADFSQWMLRHTKLYKNFYNGFHEYIWSCKSGKPKYLDMIPQISSAAIMFEEGKSEYKSGRKVEIMNLRGILIIHEPDKKQKIIKIIYLEGLAVSKVKQNNLVVGLKITHPASIYKQKTFLFHNQAITNKWIKSLADYKGQSVYTDFILEKRIGAGKFSIVYESIQITTEKLYAVKQIQTYKLSQQAKNILKNESQILSVLDHPNLPKFYKSYQSKTHIHIAMQLIQGIDLFDYIKKKGKITQYEAIPIVKQIIKGVKCFQNMGIIHRDLKPDNIILVEDPKTKLMNKVKIIDFGFATYVTDKTKHSQFGQTVGTPNFIAPQMLQQNANITIKCDNFSIGSIVYFLISGSLPFLAEDIYQVFQKTKKGEYDLQKSPWDKISLNCKKFIQSFLTVDPVSRMSLSQASRHPWLRQTIIYQCEQKQFGKKKTSPRTTTTQALLFD